MRKLLDEKGGRIALLSAGMTVVLIVTAILFSFNEGKSQPAAKDEITPAKAFCKDYKLRLDPNEKGRVITEGIGGTAPESIDKMMQATCNDWRPFKDYWNASPMGKRDPLTDKEAQALFANGVMTEEGRQKQLLMAGAYLSATKVELVAYKKGAKVENTFAKPGGGTYTKPDVLTRDRTATRVTFADGSKTEIFHECGNVIKPPPPKGKQESESHVNDGFQDEDGHNVKPPPDATPVPPDDEMPQPTATGSPSPKPTSSPTSSPTPQPTGNPSPGCDSNGACGTPNPQETPSPGPSPDPSQPPPED